MVSSDTIGEVELESDVNTLDKDSLASHRRVFRLLSILTGRPLAAGALLSEFPSSIPPGPRGERIAVHAARDMEPGRLSLLPQEIADRIYGLEPQLREAWVLRDVLGYNDRNAAIALDCSRTVVRNRMDALQGQIKNGDAEALRDCMAGLGLPEEFIRSVRDRKNARRGIRLLVGLASAVIALDLLRTWCSS